MNLDHDLHPYLFKIHFSIILPSTVRCSKQALSFRFPSQIPVCISFLHTCHAPYQSPPFNHVTNTDDEAPQYAAFSSLSTLFPNTLSLLCYSSSFPALSFLHQSSALYSVCMDIKDASPPCFATSVPSSGRTMCRV